MNGDYQLDMPLPIPLGNPQCEEWPSSEMDRAWLKGIPDVLKKYSSYMTECKIGVLAVKVVREAIFSDAILKKCTPRGWNDLPALPQTDLNQLK